MLDRASKRSVILGAVLTLATAEAARASVLVYDGFNYAAGTNVPDSGTTLNGPSGGTASWTSGWFDGSADGNAAAYTIAATGLSYPNLTATGRSLNDGNDNIGVRRNFTAQSAGTYYVSFLMSVSADAASTYAGLAVNNRAYFGLMKAGAVSQFAVGSGFAGGSPTSTGVTVTPGSTYLLVGKISFNPTGSSNLSLWVNPTNGDEAFEGAADATYLHNLAGGSAFTAFDHFQGYQSSGTYNLTMDEIRLGTSWADVTPGLPVPEPTMLSLLGGAALVLGRRRAR